MTFIFAAAAGIVALVLILVSVMTYINITTLNETKLHPSESAVTEAENEWAKSNGFEYVGSYRMRAGVANAEIWAWRRTDRPTFLCKYMVRAGNASKTSYDLMTEFADEVSITTCNTKDGSSMPLVPGAYMQSFSPIDFDGRWQKHIEAENYLMDYGGARLEMNDTPFEQAFIDAIRRQTDYIRTLPLWPVRGMYWFFIRKHLLHNKSLQTQHEKGMIKLPNELVGDIPTIEV